MRFTLGFLTGLAAAWAALAIWQRVPEFGPIDADDEPIPELSYEEAVAMRGRGVDVMHNMVRLTGNPVPRPWPTSQERRHDRASQA